MEAPTVIAIAVGLLAVVLAGTVVGVRRELGAATAARDRLLRDADTGAAARGAATAELDALVEVAGPGVLVVAPDLRIVAASATAHDLLGRGPGMLVGRTVMEAFLDPSVEEASRATLAPDAGGASVETRPAGPDGPSIVARVRRRPGGGLWLLLDDVSELRRLQRIRAEFIDNLSHELRTPITTVSLLAETLSREADAAGEAVPARMRERIGKIEVETGHLVQMVNELMDLSRIERGGPLQMVDGLDLGRIAAEAAERLRLFAERQGVDLRVEPASDLPSIRGDAARLGQVVVNLVHNAVKFSPDGGVVAVRVIAVGPPDGAAVIVEDHGIGIPRAALDRIFERFYKVDRARLRPDVGGGTGLGLAIARHVVEQHGGTIAVSSDEGAGSTFTFTIPATTPVPAS